MLYSSEKTADALVIHLSGRMEFTDHDRLREIVDLIVDAAPLPRVVLDVSALEFIDSAGLGMLLIMSEEAESRSMRLAVRGAHHDVKRSLDLSRINEIITVEP